MRIATVTVVCRLEDDEPKFAADMDLEEGIPEDLGLIFIKKGLELVLNGIDGEDYEVVER